jgi:hypothetical protein
MLLPNITGQNPWPRRLSRGVLNLAYPALPSQVSGIRMVGEVTVLLVLYRAGRSPRQEPNPSSYQAEEIGTNLAEAPCRGLP